MTLQLNIMIDVEPRHGVACNIFNTLLNKLLQAKKALIQEITTKRGAILTIIGILLPFLYFYTIYNIRSLKPHISPSFAFSNSKPFLNSKKASEGKASHISYLISHISHLTSPVLYLLQSLQYSFGCYRQSVHPCTCGIEYCIGNNSANCYYSRLTTTLRRLVFSVKDNCLNFWKP